MKNKQDIKMYKKYFHFRNRNKKIRDSYSKISKISKREYLNKNKKANNKKKESHFAKVNCNP